MPKIAFMGAGSSVFAKNVLGDCILTPEITPLDIALHDIDPVRLEDSTKMIRNIIANSGRTDITLSATLNRRESLAGANYVVNAIQVGLYDPCTITDFEVPKKYGLRQTIGDTLGIGGIFRGLRTIPVMKEFANDMEELCPNALFINYTNPMSILSGFMQRYTNIKTIGLCHSVQVCAKALLTDVGMTEYIDKCKWEIAGINHLAWLTKITDLEGNDLYPEIKRRAKLEETYETRKNDLVRLDMMDRFGYYITESSEHCSEYSAWYIKSKYPELIERYNIPLDEYPRRCINQIAGWEKMKQDLVHNTQLSHEKTYEFASFIIKAMETDIPFRVHGNVINNGLISNLHSNACVEVPCLIDRNGINPCYVGELPEQCAAIDRLHINVHLLTIQAAVTRKKEYIYMAAMLDPHTSAELSPDEIRNLCDDLIAEHGDWLPKYE
ncbi:alpha-glucosidase/alpha-galactosidase [Paludicola sp. MB14-C6]|uniref:alpha-glucosidase/alpha-galactosidase n=1 Tax=Paludihabitans sp. MB14-C6 TaxID=3070656 RepID=UPI0027DE4233|nr:alpha-glucosidase/alpha-galactosidase [Paludicola sp. MB14-C6]WMJ22172.1 alpha-glucosidase/alpha-galactosidase [Paludicola sp. MB14-C6]